MAEGKGKDPMAHLVNLVSERAGISEGSAETAVRTVIDFLKDRLPAPIASQVDSVLAGGSAGDALKGLGGMLGKK